MEISKHLNLDDIIFNICMDEIPEFKEYVTGFDDITEVLPENNADINHGKIIADSMMRRENGTYVNIEHLTLLDDEKLIKSMCYDVSFFDDPFTPFHKFMFFTGDRQHLKSTFFSGKTFDYHPNVIITKDVDGDEKINEIKNQETLTAFDVIDLIWLIRFNNTKSEKEVLLEIIDFIPDLKIEKYVDTLKKCILLWTAYYALDEVEIKRI